MTPPNRRRGFGRRTGASGGRRRTRSCARALAACCLIAAAVSGSGCRRGPDLEARRAEVLDLHRRFIQAHLDKDAELLAGPTSPDYLAVAEGRVERRNAAEMERMLSAYLQATEFTAYRDVADPIVGVSDDGSMAWAVVQVRVAGTRTMPDGSRRAFDTRWAWLTVYHREGDGWRRMVDVSTNRPWQEPVG